MSNLSRRLSKLLLFPDIPLYCRLNGLVHSRFFGRIAREDSKLNRDFFVHLWIEDRKLSSPKGKKKFNLSGTWNSFLNPFGKYSCTKASSEKEMASSRRLKPAGWLPPCESISACSPEEARIACLLARSNLLVTRDVEWANLMLGFEQQNRYAIVDVSYPQSPVGFIHEKSNAIARQLLRLRRPFVAYISDVAGDELFTIRRPFWWITSSIYAEIDGKEIGVVHRRWHLWRRIYDLYLGNQQFAVVENPGFWNWTFTLKDIDGNVLAEIDRNWRGFGFEIFTDAGQYVIRFGRTDRNSMSGRDTAQELDVKRSLYLSERAVTLALAVSLDNDYFSRHGGWGIPFIAVED